MNSNRLTAVTVLTISLLAGCTEQRLHRTLLAVSNTLIAFDYCQTLPMTTLTSPNEPGKVGWTHHTREGNLIIGPTPSATVLTAYAAAALVANTGLYAAMGASDKLREWRILPLVIVTIMQMSVIELNMMETPKPYCVR